MSTRQGPSAPRRADAVRNRARLLQVADEVFAEHGPAGTTEEVARRAGVAVGTVFRHFPTKEALTIAVFTERLRVLVAEAEALLDADDPATAFDGFFRRWTELTVRKQPFVEALRRLGYTVSDLDGGDYPRLRAQLLDAVGTLLARAQEAGAVRDDVDAEHVYALVIGAAQAVEQLGDRPAAAQVVDIMLDGLRG